VFDAGLLGDTARVMSPSSRALRASRLTTLLPLLLVVSACAPPSRTPLPKIPPPAPIMADAPSVPGTPEQECGKVVTDLRRYSQCGLLDKDRKWFVARWLEAVEIDLALATSPKLDDASKQQIAVACHKAAAAVGNAAERCAQEAAVRPR
jgi:hypothetical protein